MKKMKRGSITPARPPRAFRGLRDTLEKGRNSNMNTVDGVNKKGQL